MRILVTGGCGYVGTVLVNRLLELEHEVLVADAMWFGNFLKPHKGLKVIKADIRDIENIPFNGIQTVFHLANVANDPCSELDSKLSWEVNALATMRMAEAAIVAGVRQFVYASSGSVYGVKQEERVTEDLSLVPISDYNKTKMVSERILLSYSDRILVQCVRPATVCGWSPRMRLDLSVNMLTIQALSKGLITVFGGEQTRPNIHIKDMVGVYEHFLGKGSSLSGIFNAGFENLSIMDIANAVVSLVPAEITVTQSNDPRSYRLCSDKLLNTGFVPRHSVAEGIRDVVQAYRDGILADGEEHYNVKVMKRLGV